MADRPCGHGSRLRTQAWRCTTTSDRRRWCCHSVRNASSRGASSPHSVHQLAMKRAALFAHHGAEVEPHIRAVVLTHAGVPVGRTHADDQVGLAHTAYPTTFG